MAEIRRFRVGENASLLVEEIKRWLIRLLQQAGARFVSRMIRERLSGPTAANSLSRRTGQLARSVTFKVTPGASNVTLNVSIGANAPYAQIHETGGVIYAKHAENLAIPLPAAKTKAGVARLASPRQDATLKFMISRAGNKLLVRITGKGKGRKIIPMYVLKNRVIIPARLGFAKTFEREAKQIIDEVRAGLQFFAKRGGRVA